MIEHIEPVIKKIQQIAENTLTNDYIIPLLEDLGYHRVEFFGGQSEEGKDILFWEKDRLDDLRLYVAQVKHFKFTNKASDKRGLATIVNQIGQCFNRSMPYSDKTLHRPAEVFLISTHPVDTKTLLTRFGEYPLLKDQQIRIIDGVKLATLLIKHRPQIIKALLGLDYEVKSKILPTLNNKILLNALGYKGEKHLKTIYTDIDFSVGKTTTDLFFHSKFYPSHKQLELNPVEIGHFKEVLKDIRSQYPPNFLDKTLDELEQDIKESIDQRDLENRIRVTSKKHSESSDRLDMFKKSYSAQKAELTKFEYENPDFYGSKKWRKLVDATENAQNRIFTSEKELQKVKYDLQILGNHKNAQFAKVNIDGREVVRLILDRRGWIEEQVALFNVKRPNNAQLREFIIACQDIIHNTSLILRHQRFFSCIGMEEQRVIRRDFESTRFKLPIDLIFDTGLNYIVLGEAGAGKTTSLQMYVFNRQELSDKLIIWLPLARLIQGAIDDGQDLNDHSLQDNFEEIIFNHLLKMGINITKQEFMWQLTSRQTILLFDGLDEAIKPAPWLTKTIKSLSTKYQNQVQIIVTCRSSGKYLEEIPFFAVTLLPFTRNQRDRFIEQWFAEEPDSSTVTKIKRHLEDHKAIGEIITNPLLATTLCVLAKHKLPLPKTEINLYDSRIRLLTGHYDNVKRIDSRVSVPPQVLEGLAQKMAFFFHLQNKREDHISAITENIRKIVNYEMDGQEAITALHELVDPCNLLVPMSEDGKFGFGHLKYQEHLAAKELLANRGIDVLKFLKNPWWREALILLARMSYDLTWLVKQVGLHEQCTEFASILQDMIKVRPKLEQQMLETLFKKYLILENNHSFADRDVINDDELMMYKEYQYDDDDDDD